MSVETLTYGVGKKMLKKTLPIAFNFFSNKILFKNN